MTEYLAGLATKIVAALDDFARDYDPYECGLPVYGPTMDDMVEIVMKLLKECGGSAHAN